VFVYQELKEEHTRVLSAVNPHAPQNIVRFNFKVSQGRLKFVELHDAAALTSNSSAFHAPTVCNNMPSALQTIASH